MKHPATRFLRLQWAPKACDDTVDLAIDFDPLNDETEWWLFLEDRLIGHGTGLAKVNITCMDDIDTLYLFMRNSVGYTWKKGIRLKNAWCNSPKLRATAVLLGLPI